MESSEKFKTCSDHAGILEKTKAIERMASECLKEVKHSARCINNCDIQVIQFDKTINKLEQSIEEIYTRLRIMEEFKAVLEGMHSAQKDEIEKAFRTQTTILTVLLVIVQLIGVWLR